MILFTCFSIFTTIIGNRGVKSATGHRLISVTMLQKLINIMLMFADFAAVSFVSLLRCLSEIGWAGRARKVSYRISNTANYYRNAFRSRLIYPLFTPAVDNILLQPCENLFLSCWRHAIMARMNEYSDSRISELWQIDRHSRERKQTPMSKAKDRYMLSWSSSRHRKVYD